MNPYLGAPKKPLYFSLLPPCQSFRIKQGSQDRIPSRHEISALLALVS